MIENDEVEQPETVTQGPGQILKLAREKANLSSQDIADKMRLKKSVIEDLEQDNFDINISLTFIRGYLKLYARHVKVAETEILKAFENLSTQEAEPAKLQSFSRRVANQANDDKLMLVTYLIVAVVIALVVIWWFQQRPNDPSTTSTVNSYPEAVSGGVIEKKTLPLKKPSNTVTSSLSSEPIDEPIAEVSTDQGQADFEEPIIEELTIINQSIATDTVDDPANASIVEEVDQVEQANADVDTTTVETAAPIELIFEFAGDCWMNLSDATGENIAYGVKVKGRVMPVTGIPPFVVTLGAPEVVKISYADEPIDMSFLPAGRIAKFDLPRPE